METVTDFIFLGSKITVDGDCSHKIKRCWFFGRKAMTNLDSILKSRDTTLLTMVHLVKAMVFPEVMYRCELDHKESWAVKNRCFWTVMLEKNLESPLDCREIQPVNPKGNQSWVTLEGLMLKLKLQYFGQLMWRTDSLEKMVGWHHQFNAHEFEQALGFGHGQGSLCAAVHGMAKSWAPLSKWTMMNNVRFMILRRRFSFGTREQAWLLRALVREKFYYSEKGQRKFLT